VELIFTCKILVEMIRWDEGICYTIVKFKRGGRRERERERAREKRGEERREGEKVGWWIMWNCWD